MAFLFPRREPKSRTLPTKPRRSLLVLPKPEKVGHQGRISLLLLLLVRIPPFSRSLLLLLPPPPPLLLRSIDTMPSLVNDLSPPQRSWLFENFGHNGDHDELQQELTVAAHFPTTTDNPDDRRFTEPIDPYQPPRELHGGGGDGAGGAENRSAIFRRAGAGGGAGRSPGPDSNHASPRPWSPVGTGALEEPYFYDSRGYFVRTPPFPPPTAGMPEMGSPSKRAIGERMPVLTDEGGKRPVFPHGGEKLTWQQSFENLIVYKQTYGDCNVPQKYKLNSKLGGWVNKQRKKKKNPSKYGKLTESQITVMEDLGFKWNIEQGI